MASPEERDAQALQEKIARIKARLAEEKKRLPEEPRPPAEKPLASLEIEVPVKKAGAPPQAVAPKPVEAPPQQPPAKKPGFFARLFAPKPAKPIPEAQKPAAKPQPVPAVPLTPPALAKAELKKAREKEAELILRDIVGAAEKEAAAAEAAPAGQAPPVHRRYLLKRREKIVAPTPEQAREKEELAVMAAELYPAFKPVEEPRPAEKPVAVKPEVKPGKPARPAPEKKEARKPEKKTVEAPAKELTLEEIIGGTPAKEGAAPPETPLFPPAPSGGEGTPLFAELGAITGETPAKPQEKPVEKPLEKPLEGVTECPTCHSKNVKVVFCPYCGAGMCVNCSPSVRVEADAMIYTCPKCGEEVTVRKKQP